MRPSVVLDMKRSAVREAVGRFRAANPRVFGSVLHDAARIGCGLLNVVEVIGQAVLAHIGCASASTLARNFGGRSPGVSRSTSTPSSDFSSSSKSPKDDFLADKRTQQAVIMSLIVIGEAATKVMDGYVEFTQAHADVPWRSMRNMRNRMAHGYFDINLDVVWETVQEWLPALLQQLPAVRQDADDEDRNDKGG